MFNFLKNKFKKIGKKDEKKVQEYEKQQEQLQPESLNEEDEVEQEQSQPESLNEEGLKQEQLQPKSSNEEDEVEQEQLQPEGLNEEDEVEQEQLQPESLNEEDEVEQEQLQSESLNEDEVEQEQLQPESLNEDEVEQGQLQLESLNDDEKMQEIERLLKDNLTKERSSEIDKSNFDNIKTGYDFEYYLKSIFDKLGFLTTVSKTSQEQGANLILEKDDTKTVVQAKFYNSPIDNKAIEELAGSLRFYNAQKGIVVTNNIFTKSAIELAAVNNIKLIDGNELDKIRQDIAKL
ncbi:DUF2034 domain-containing protein [Clostridium sp. WILCCON 0269]|uniref:DUF2034 domain-containing protein n=1 Tax=Candidatus Clostridium eludens TaxID=3381663 RepID=A0ABW8SET4_9CLOT